MTYHQVLPCAIRCSSVNAFLFFSKPLMYHFKYCSRRPSGVVRHTWSVSAMVLQVLRSSSHAVPERSAITAISWHAAKYSSEIVFMESCNCLGVRFISLLRGGEQWGKFYTLSHIFGSTNLKLLRSFDNEVLVFGLKPHQETNGVFFHGKHCTIR